MTTDNKFKKLNFTSGALYVTAAATLLAIACVTLGSAVKFMSRGIEPFWYANIGTLIFGLFLTWLIKALIVILIAGNFVMFGLFLAMGILTFIFSAKADVKVMKGLQAASLVFDVVMLYNLIKIIIGFLKSLRNLSFSLPATDIAVYVLIFLATAAVFACTIVTVVNLATAKTPAKNAYTVEGGADGGNL